MPRNRALEISVQLRDNVEQRRIEIPQPRARLVRDFRSRHAAAVGEPERCDFTLDRPGIERGRIARELGVGALAEQFAEAFQFREQRAALRLGGMRREHELDRHAIDDRLDRRGVGALFLQRQNRGLDALADRRCCLVAQPCGAAAAQEHDAEILLGEIHELEVERKRHRLVERIGRRERRDRGGEFFLRRAIAGAAGLRKLAERLDGVEGLASLEARDHAPERGAERADFGAKLGELVQRGQRRRDFGGHGGEEALRDRRGTEVKSAP